MHAKIIIEIMHYTHVTWASWRLKSLKTQRFFQQLVQGNRNWKHWKLQITTFLWGEFCHSVDYSHPLTKRNFFFAESVPMLCCHYGTTWCFINNQSVSVRLVLSGSVSASAWLPIVIHSEFGFHWAVEIGDRECPLSCNLQMNKNHKYSTKKPVYEKCNLEWIEQTFALLGHWNCS